MPFFTKFGITYLKKSHEKKQPMSNHLTNLQEATNTQESTVKSSEIISSMFNRISGTYDLMNNCISTGMHRSWKRKACLALNLQPGDSALDICTGTGDLIPILSKIVGPGGEVTGIDFSESMLEVAKKRFSKISNVTWLQGDALSLPFDNNRFNGAIISFGLRNVGSVHKALSEMVRVVKPGGWIVNLDTASDCKNPLFWFYFSKIMPLAGKIFADDYQAYRYLYQSTRTFETPGEIELLFRHLGLKKTGINYLGFKSVSFQAGCKDS